MLGENYDVDIIDIYPDFPVVFLPENICREDSDGEIRPLVYILDASGLTTNNTFLIDYEKARFSTPLLECEGEFLTGVIAGENVIYSSPRFVNDISDKGAKINFWGKRYSEYSLNGNTIPSIFNQGDAMVAGHYISGEAADNAREFSYIDRGIGLDMPDADQSFYISDRALFTVNRFTEEVSIVQLSHPDYTVNGYAAATNSSLIYSVGVWGDEKTTVLGVHHILVAQVVV